MPKEERDMLKLLKTTIAGGLIFLLPVAILGFILGKIVVTAEKLAEPISDKLPVSSFAGVSATIILAVLGLIVISFLAGLLAKTRIAQQTMKQLESQLLGRIPAYGLLKSLGTDFVSPEQGADRRVVLVRFDDAWQMAIKIDTAIDRLHTVVFVPDSPTPQSGSVMIVESSRVHETDIPLRKAMSVLAVRGMGLQDLLQGQLRPGAATLGG
jgi:uncharacterized membrane protein